MKKAVIEYNPTDAVPFISSYEGCKLKAYKDAFGVWTIGYGHTKDVLPTDVISQDQAIMLLYEDITTFHDELISLVKVSIGPNQFIALMSFLYNFGLTKCKTYSLFEELNKKNYLQAARKFPDYRNPGSKIEHGLLKRRLAELQLFLEDEVLTP